MHLTVFRNRAGFELAEYNMGLSDLLEWVRNPPFAATKDELPLIKLARFGDVRSAKGSLRHDRNVLGISGIEADYDAGEMAPDTAADLIRAAGMRAIIYTSPGYTVERPRWRVLAPLTCEFPTSERRVFVERLNGVLGGVLARESFTLSQAFYFGRVEGAAYESWSTT